MAACKRLQIFARDVLYRCDMLGARRTISHAKEFSRRHAPDPNNVIDESCGLNLYQTRLVLPRYGFNNKYADIWDMPGIRCLSHERISAYTNSSWQCVYLTYNHYRLWQKTRLGLAIHPSQRKSLYYALLMEMSDDGLMSSHITFGLP